MKPDLEPEGKMHLQVEGLPFETLAKSIPLYFKPSSYLKLNLYYVYYLENLKQVISH